MKRRLSYGVIAGAVAVVLVLLLLHAPAPLLYSQKDDAITRFHTNTQVLGAGRPQDAAEVLPLMGDLLNQHGSLTLNVRLGDYDLAARDLREFLSMGGRLDSLVINLDMSESEIEEWRRLNREDISLLSELVNDTGTLDQLRQLEVRYRAEGNREELYAVSIQGETLERRLQQLYTEYRANKEPMIELSRKYELDTTQYEQSVADFATIVEGFTRAQDTRQYTFVQAGSVLSLEVFPETGVYHDTFTFSGTLGGREPENREIRVYIDAMEALTATTGTGGEFRRGYFIERIKAGEHTAYAQFGQSTFSNPVTFRVRELATSLTMTPDQDGRKVTCEGVLMAGRIPVTRAPVEIQANGGTVGRTLTDAQGRYKATVTLAPGKYLVRSWFGADDYPLSQAWSPAVSMTIAPETGVEGVTHAGTVPLIVLVLIIGASIAAAAWYLLRKIPPATPGEAGPEVLAPDEPGTANIPARAVTVPPLTRDEAIAAYQEGAATDAGAAAIHLFLYLVTRCQERLGLRNTASLTPREICRQTRSRPFFEAFRTFITGYEPVRYGGGTKAGEAARSTIVAQFTAVSDAIEEDHP